MREGGGWGTEVWRYKEGGEEGACCCRFPGPVWDLRQDGPPVTSERERYKGKRAPEKYA